MLRSILIILVSLSLNLQAQSKAQKEFMHYCMHEATEAQVHTIMLAADEPTRERSCQFLARTRVPIELHRAIRLRDSSITDITPLKYLKGVKEVSLSDNNITDITPLAQLAELRAINLDSNPIANIKPLIGLDKLESLEIRATSRLDDLSPLLDMIYLKELYCSEGNKNLKNLKFLSLYKTGLSDISDIVYLKNLTEIDLEVQPLLVDISEIKNLKNLSRVTLKNVNIDDVSALKDLPNLGTLTLINTKVKDLSVLTGKKIKLDARGNDLRWCSPKDWSDLIDGVSCYEKDGTEKSWWKRLFRL